MPLLEVLHSEVGLAMAVAGPSPLCVGSALCGGGTMARSRGILVNMCDLAAKVEASVWLCGCSLELWAHSWPR
jgi:hypothetical protein